MRALRGLGFAAVAACSLLLIAIVAVFVIGASGLGSDRLRKEAEAAIQRIAGAEVTTTVGQASLALDGSHFIALEVRDVKFASADAGGVDMLHAGHVRFGLRFWPLMSGSVRLGSATISDARFVPSALPSMEGSDWKASLVNAEGLIDPDRVVKTLLGGLHRAFDMMEFGSTRYVELENVEFVLPEGAKLRSVLIAGAQLNLERDGELAIAAHGRVDGRAFSFDGTAARDATSRRISKVDLGLIAPAADAAAQASRPGGSRIGAAEISVTGAEGIGAEASRLSAKVRLAHSVLDLGLRGQLAGDLEIAGVLAAGTHKVEIESLNIAIGRSRFNFHGAVGPAPPEQHAGSAYRYELATDGSTLAPESSFEPALQFVAGISGTYDPLKNLLTASQLRIRTGSGELTGTASLEFAKGKAPGISVALNVPGMAVSHVKQLWPWFAVGGARRWVQKNLYGGRVVDSSLRYSVAVGRIGNGVPLGHDEVSGKFNIESTRFDVAGRIPPVREAFGSVDFRGSDVDIAVSSGSVFMPSGRKVEAKNGTLVLRGVNRQPIIGKLDMDIMGEADAVAELASCDPINAMRHVGFAPEELAGTVEGHVRADIPLHSGIDFGKLDWLVSLDYRNLSIAKLFEGQKVTGAQGTITVDPLKAVIEAKARLNGAPAEIAMVEPLNGRGPQRQRNVELVLDDKARDALVPGLASVLSGPVKVEFNSSGGGKQEIAADLTNAKLNIPWAGWSKGAGVSADVKFSLETSEGAAKLSAFKLSGKSFAVEGEMTLKKGELSSARFDTLRLNRGDDVSLAIERSGKGYDVEISGAALDSRAVIKQFTADADKAAGPTGTMPVSLKATVATLTGFHGERLSNVKLGYSGIGSKVLALNVSAVTKSGAEFTVKNSMAGNRRTMDMQSRDAGAILRFLDIYEHMQGGSIKLALAGSADGALQGQVDATDFQIVDEPRLRSIVATAPTGDGRSLNQAVRGNIDTSSVQFERGYAEIEKGDGYLTLANGVLRGPLIGTTFQGTLYDGRGNMAMTGTFMPAYGVNRLFGELPFVGMILGNGRDRGLIGVTYKLSGEAKSPDLQINPLSVIAPGIFRSIFEFR